MGNKKIIAPSECPECGSYMGPLYEEYLNSHNEDGKFVENCFFCDGCDVEYCHRIFESGKEELVKIN